MTGALVEHTCGRITQTDISRLETLRVLALGDLQRHISTISKQYEQETHASELGHLVDTLTVAAVPLGKYGVLVARLHLVLLG